MSLYAIGDIHGSFQSLKSLFTYCDFSKDDTIVFLGDYVNKGLNSREVVEFLIKYSKELNLIFLKGNHEILMLEARKKESVFKEWCTFGGDKTLESYNVNNLDVWVDSIPLEHWAFLENGESFYMNGDYVFVHAGLEKGKELHEQNMHHLFWKKYETPEMVLENKTVICGHTSRKNGEIANFGHTICIDTYAHGGMWLTCLNVETKEYIKTSENGDVTKGKL